MMVIVYGLNEYTDWNVLNYLYTFGPLFKFELMFFFGAFSGNFIYLISAVLYLAGFTILLFRSTKDQTKDFKTSEALVAPVLFENTLKPYSIHYYTFKNNHADHAVHKLNSLQPPVSASLSLFCSIWNGKTRFFTLFLLFGNYWNFGHAETLSR